MLTDRDRQILAFEEKWWRGGGLKDEQVRRTFGVMPGRYYQLLGALIEREDAEAAAPVLVHRLRREAARRRADRARRLDSYSR